MAEEKNNPEVEEVESVDIDQQAADTQAEADAQETVEEAVSELDQLQADKEALEDQVLRLQAEIANIQRTNARNSQLAERYRSQRLATSLLDVVDNLERALDTEIESEDGKALKKGVEMVLNQFQNAFQSEKIEVVDPVGQAFDPNYHQAVSVIPAEEDQDHNVVAQVLQKGYILDERVLRPAMVVVTEK
ncbi:nucleotide exchange factor GrpE [Hutsoniella sourekii]